MPNRPLIGVSTCLLGENVRYDGAENLNSFVVDKIGKVADFVPVCPEVECGMPVPREPIRLVDMNGSLRLLSRKDAEDRTPMMTGWINRKLDELTRLPLCGFIFKAKSPSCGLRSTALYDSSGRIIRADGSGLFCSMFVLLFPGIPVIEETDLCEPEAGFDFLTRVQETHRRILSSE